MSNTLSKSPTMTKSKTHPGGVQGALSRFWYHSDETPFPVNKPPTANAAKLRSKKMRVGSVFFMGCVQQFLKVTKKSPPKEGFFCGVGGVRTLVQTTSFQAFYMLSSWLVFDMRPDKNTQRAYLGFLVSCCGKTIGNTNPIG